MRVVWHLAWAEEEKNLQGCNASNVACLSMGCADRNAAVEIPEGYKGPGGHLVRTGVPNLG